MKKQIKVITICATIVAMGAFCIYAKLKKGDVTLKAQVLETQQECIDAFGKNGKRLLGGKGENIHPIFITIENNSQETVSIHSIDVKMAKKRDINKRILGRRYSFLGLLSIGAKIIMVTTIAGGIFGLSIPFLFSCGVGVVIVYDPLLSPFLANIFALAGFSAGLFVAAPTAMIVYGSKWDKPSRKLKQKLKKSSPSTSIEPSITKTIIFFVKERDYKENFTIQLAGDKSNQPVEYNVQLPSLRTIKVDQQ